ncbi:GEVED domain-containing protein [Flavobacterium sp. NRK F10]|uniref:GEVED domain-containing protein n=1 Tax=Flavobacterium sp. NRK F10 TaxID=2954931 RepID=UPI002091CDBE|nr:GEVED domain-containing protein [Flavobacterium sp. NRK F10]MCO6175459.1 GEVED domain-containing protein [Flavobacterium sp. NRK F10]
MKKNLLGIKSPKDSFLLKHCINKYLISFFLLLFFSSVFSQSANDNCSNATPLTLGTSCSTASFTFTSNTLETGAANPILCNSVTANKDGWYTFTTGASTTSITLEATTNRPWSASIYSGNCSGFTLVDCDNASGNTAITLTPTVSPNTTYYVRINRTNTGTNSWSGNVCVYDSTPSVSYCTFTSSSSSYWISNFTTTGGSTNINNSTTYSTNGYGDYSSQIVTQTAGLSFNFSVTMDSGTHGINIFVDWNNDGDFADTGEKVYASGSYVSSASGTITIPGATTSGNYRMRVATNYLSTDPSACGSTTYTEAEDYTIQVAPLTPCSGTPTGGSVTVSPATGNPGSTYNVSATGYTIGAGLTYQWQSNTNSGGWTNVGSASTTYSDPAAQTAPALGTVVEWQLIVTCTNSGNSATSSTATFTSELTPCTPSGSTSYYLTNVTTTNGLTNFNNTSGAGTGGYTDNYPTISVSQIPGGSFDISITPSTGTNYYYVWIDWNNDADFDDAGETLVATTSYASNYTGTINIPVAQTNGTFRMRVANSWSGSITSCGPASYGEYEDYAVIVGTISCYPPTLTADATSTTTGTASWIDPTLGSTPVGYEYYISTTNTPPASGTATASTSTSFTGLISNTTYYVFVRTNCGGGDYSPWAVDSFYTGYCTANSSYTSDYITDFTTTSGVSNISNTSSGFSTSGYGDFTGQIVSQYNGGSVNFNVILNSSSGFAIWVDWNDDMVFDATERMYTSNAYGTTFSGSFNVPAGAATGDHRMRIRSNYSSSNPDACGSISYGEAEDYTFTILPPLPCGENPESLSVFLVSQTEATVSWTEPTPVPANGYQYYFSTSNTTPTSGSTPTGSVTSGTTSVNFTGLIPGTTYYVWVRSNCGAPDGQGVWVGPVIFTMPTCAIGDSTGTTDLGCPSVLSGGLSLNGADPAPFFCTDASTCVDLEANYLDLGDTSSYTVESITYNPPYQFSCLKNPVSVNIDDRWSPIVTLPFDFCFYGNTYNQCSIGSNGLLTFDISVADSGSGYSFDDDLPSTTGALFANTIYGVYHDIDPSEGGEVGWELITLNTGCRALVVGWSDVPMFSDNSILYTGMMVLYENTNVIEVYIKEKHIDNNNVSPWNNGNAIVGIQNADATLATVAPGRNGLDTNWEATNEAWRFVPSGTSITSLTWYEGAGTSGPIIGTTDVINVCPSATTTYTAAITYTLCDGTVLTETDETTVTVNGAKVWNGSINNDWDNDNNWTPAGKPTALDCVVIPDTTTDPVISGTGYNGVGLNLSIQNDASLTVNTDNAVTITDWVNISTTGDLILDNAGSLVQINNISNSGSGAMHMDRDTNIRKLDYVYWSSPVTSFSSGNISPNTTGAIYKWTPTIASNLNGYGNWSGGIENMTIGKGYIVRGPDNYTTALQNFTATFAGTPNNGNISTPIVRGTYDGADYTTCATCTLATKDDDNWNLVGNPYPSAINAINFLTTNTNIAGFVKLWTHGTLPSSAIVDPFYDSFVYNYTPGDYLTYNATGTSSGPGVFNGSIAAGQGFFVLMNHAGATSQNVSFNNSMRSNLYDNGEFFKNASSGSNIDRHRIWLDLIAPDNTSVRALVGYIDGATNDEDRLYDAITDKKLNLNLFSLVNNQEMTIQGRQTPFNVNDQVPLGINVPQDGIYSIGIGALDGLFGDTPQDIYLEDLTTNVIHDLRSMPYTFSTTSGIFNNRFVLRYTINSLSTEDINEIENNVWAVTENELTVKSSIERIRSVQVFDVLGRHIASKSNVENNEVIFNSLQKNNTTLLLQITLESGITIHKKVIF